MMFFDANAIIGKGPKNIPRYNITPEDLLHNMDRLNIEKSIVSSFEERNCYGWDDLIVKKSFLKNINAFSDRLLPCLSIKSEAILCMYDDKAFMQNLLETGVKAVSISTYHGNAVMPWCFDVIADILIKHNIILFYNLLSDQGDFSFAAPSQENWDILYEIATAYPALKIVLFSPNLGVKQHQCMSILRHCKNVSLDISSIQWMLVLKSLVDKFGAERFIFGGYSPFFEPAQFMLEVLYADISDSDKEKIAWRNLDSLITSGRLEL